MAAANLRCATSAVPSRLEPIRSGGALEIVAVRCDDQIERLESISHCLQGLTLWASSVWPRSTAARRTAPARWSSSAEGSGTEVIAGGTMQSIPSSILRVREALQGKASRAETASTVTQRTSLDTQSLT